MRNFSQLTSSSTNTNTKLFALTGTGATATDSTTVTGSGSAFLSQVRIGDKIKVGTNQYRTVTAVNSNTDITVDLAFTATAATLAMDIIPAECVNGQGRNIVIQNVTGNTGVISFGESIVVNKDGSDVTTTSNSYSMVAGVTSPVFVSSIANVYIQCTVASQRYQVIVS